MYTHVLCISTQIHKTLLHLIVLDHFTHNIHVPSTPPHLLSPPYPPPLPLPPPLFPSLPPLPPLFPSLPPPPPPPPPPPSSALLPLFLLLLAIPGLILITDGVCGFSSGSAMTGLLGQLRAGNVSCWVVVVGGGACAHTGFGLSPDMETLYFITKACNGCVIDSSKVLVII